jgi:FkbM family methyltransferase
MTIVAGGTTMAVRSLRIGEKPLLHAARSFERLPSIDDAPRLLAALATAPSAFAPVSADRPLALYGAGEMGRLARIFLKIMGLDFVMAVDRDAGRISNDTAWSDVRLLHPNDVTESDKRDVLFLVCNAKSPYAPLERSLIEQGFRHVVPFYDLAENFRHLHPLSNGWFAPPLTADDQAKTTTVLARWDDDLSRAHHLQFLAWRRLREEWTFEPAPAHDPRRFFIPDALDVLHDHEVFLDGGAHLGSVSERFIQHTAGGFQNIIAMEPDPANLARLKVEFQQLLPNDPRVEIFNCALGERDGKATFHDGLNYVSQVSDTGRMQIAIRPLDALGVAPTFVKLHLEGGELAALKGARRTLQLHRPIVTATVYHNADGIWRTPLWLMETLTDYRYLFRAHSWCGTGAVVYAIPNERRAA